MTNASKYRLVVVGTSAGGLNVLAELLKIIPTSFPVPIAIVQHLGKGRSSNLPEILSNLTFRKVTEIEDKMLFITGGAFTAPSDYHVLVEADGHFSLSVDDEINYSRPSIDILFESAASSFGAAVVGIILTGANQDGAQGLARIVEAGGYAMVQDPKRCEFRAMPAAALKLARPHFVGSVEEIGRELLRITRREEEYN